MFDLGLSATALNGYTATVAQIQIQYKDGTTEYTLSDYSTTIRTGTAFSSGTPVAPISNTMYTK